jgi:cyclopropane fatty-acyl-phospholipid synthase-like methyltransferase
MMGLKPGMRVLDVGCGVGGPAREIAGFADVTIVGLNNNDFQIGRANAKTRKAGLSDKVSFSKGDFMKLSEQFGEGSFDASELIHFGRGYIDRCQFTPLRRLAMLPLLKEFTGRFSNA